MAEEKIIYVEFASRLPQEALSMEPQPSDINLAGVDFVEIDDYLRQQGMVRKEFSFGPETEKSSGRARFLTLYFRSETDVIRVAQELNRREGVIHAIEARKLVPSAASGNPLNEPLVQPRLGGVVTPNDEHQWYLFRCCIDQAWAQNLSGKEIITADIDWGFLTSHQDFENRIAFTLNTIDGSAMVNGGSAIDHGTAVLGLVGAANNGLGMVGVAFDSELWAIQAGEDRTGTFDPTPWWRALQEVKDKDASGKRKVVLLELQTEFHENIDVIPPIRAAIQEALLKGIVVCVPAGNGSRDAGLDVHNQPFPASGSILAGATAYNDTENPIWHDSNHGLRVPIYAPGAVDHDLTCSSDDNDRYRDGFGGTSGAAPKVAGTIALMLEANPKLCHYEIKDILKQTGTLVTGDPSLVKGTFLNAEAAVAEAIRRRIP